MTLEEWEARDEGARINLAINLYRKSLLTMEEVNEMWRNGFTPGPHVVIEQI